jgi:hypothetical protein
MIPRQIYLAAVPLPCRCSPAKKQVRKMQTISKKNLTVVAKNERGIEKDEDG